MGKPFAIVGDVPEQQPQPGAPSPEVAQALQILMLSLKTVSQRFITGLSHLFTAAALASAWYLWLKILPNPTVTQLVGAALYAAFLLSIEFVRRSR